ncbi:MAG: urease accessory protein UreE [Ginsengibacter sp.]
MLIQRKLGNIHSSSTNNLVIDKLIIEWYETGKRILHKETESGNAVILKFLNENPDLKDGDILWQDQHAAIAIEIKPCESIVITPGNALETASICYEIGNRHLPLFHEGNELLIPYEAPIHNLLNAAGYKLAIEERKLNNCFKTTVLPHLQVAATDSLFSRVNKLSTTI